MIQGIVWSAAVVIFILYILYGRNRCPKCWNNKWSDIIGGRGGEICLVCGHIQKEISEEAYMEKHFSRPSPEDLQVDPLDLFPTKYRGRGQGPI